MAGERVEVSLSGSMPETVQAVIAARLDGIPEGPRQLVQNAVRGGDRVRPAPSPRSAARRRSGLDDVADLVRRGLVVRSPESAIEGEPQYTFGHALIREVAYTRLTREQRGAGTWAAARWIEARPATGWRSAPSGWHADYAEAAELGLGAARRRWVPDPREPAITWLLAAGDLAGRLDAGLGPSRCISAPSTWGRAGLASRAKAMRSSP